MDHEDAPYRDEDTLRQKYCVEDFSTRELAEKWECSRSTISNWCKRFGIELESAPQDPPWQDRETLHELYNERDMTAAEVGAELGCSGRTITKWVRKYGLKLHKNREWLDKQFNDEGLSIGEIATKANADRKTVSHYLDELDVRSEDDRPADYADEKPWHDPEELKRLYHGEQLSAARVAEQMGCSPQTVRHWLIEFDIPRRGSGFYTLPKSESRQNWYETISGPGNESVLHHRLLCYAVGKISFEELCDPNVVIHHETNVPWDNRPCNLTPMSRSDHMTLHGQNDYEPRES